MGIPRELTKCSSGSRIPSFLSIVQFLSLSPLRLVRDLDAFSGAGQVPEAPILCPPLDLFVNSLIEESLVELMARIWMWSWAGCTKSF